MKRLRHRQITRLLTLLLPVAAGCNVNERTLLSGDASADNDIASAKVDPQQSECTTKAECEDTADQVLRLLNVERLDVGPVEFDPDLTSIAARYACTMIDQGFFGHTDSTGHGDLGQRVEAAGYGFQTIGENLAAGIFDAPEIIDAWLASSRHRDVMLDPTFTRAGIAVRYGGDFGVYCVLLLAEPGH